MSEHGKRARALFEEGYNCAQSVAGAFAEEMGIPLPQVVRMISAFGGGIGRLRETCGAVSGMAFVIGTLYGYDSPTAVEEKKELYALTQQLVRAFEAQSGSLLCRQLLGITGEERDPTPEERTPEYYNRRPCPALIAQAADILDGYIRENKYELSK